MPKNQYVTSDEYVFVQYHDIVKSYKPYLLKHMLNSDYREGYADYINFDLFKDYSDSKLLGLAIKSTEPNVLKFIKTKDFYYDICLEDILSQLPEVYRDSKLLSIGTSLSMLLTQKYVKKIYIHSPVYDERILTDIQESYGFNPKVIYVSGDFIGAVKQCPDTITTYIINDIRLIDELIKINKVEYSNIMVADCGWNYRLTDNGGVALNIDDLDKKMKTHIFKSAMFRVDKELEY